MAKVALLIGVSEYTPGLIPLPAAVQDVVALQRVLKDPELGEFDQITTLNNPEPQEMQYAIETLFAERSKEDFVLLFFSGHGIKDDSNNLYFATRITEKSPKGDLVRSTAVPARFIHEVMNNSRAKRQAIILDCCFSGAFDPTLQSKDDGNVDLQGQLGAEGRVVLASSSSTQYSFEQQGSELSLYTRYLVEGIETGAGDRNEDGKISMLELHEYATSRVQETAPNMTPKLITLKDMGFEITLAKAKVTDPKLRYRRQVERYSSRGSISSIGRTILDQLQTQLALTPEVAQGIETEVLRPYQQRLENLQRYRHVFREAVEHEYPLSSYAESELRDLREILGLRQKDIDQVEQEVLAQILPQPSPYAEGELPAVQSSDRSAIAISESVSSSVQPVTPDPVPVPISPTGKAVEASPLPVPPVSLVKRSAIAAAGIFTLLLGGVAIVSSTNSNINAGDNNNVEAGETASGDGVTTYTVGALKITGDRQHVCNVLLPRGPGIGGDFSYADEAALWSQLGCESLYCDLSDADCRTSLKPQWANPDPEGSGGVSSIDGSGFSLVDQVIQFPEQPIPASPYTENDLSAGQLTGLGALFQQFEPVENDAEPVAAGSSTTYEAWTALCIGEEGQSGCPKSARHEVLSYGSFQDNIRLWTSRGWLLYR